MDKTTSGHITPSGTKARQPEERGPHARDVEGILAADTPPWGTLEEFISEREAFDTWRRSRRRVLKTAADHADFVRWRVENPARRAIGSKGDRTALATLFIRAWARRLLGLPGGDLRRDRRGDDRRRLPHQRRRDQEGAPPGGAALARDRDPVGIRRELHSMGARQMAELRRRSAGRAGVPRCRFTYRE